MRIERAIRVAEMPLSSELQRLPQTKTKPYSVTLCQLSQTHNRSYRIVFLGTCSPDCYPSFPARRGRAYRGGHAHGTYGECLRKV
jgi:hypothetical protein